MSIKLKGSSDGSVSFDAPADTSPSGSDITLTLPTSAGSANQFLKNSGIAGTLEYSSMIETSTGVGIGESSPNTKLVVKDASNALNDSVGNINVISSDSAAIDKGGSIGLGGFYNGTSNSIPFANIHGKKENSTGNNAEGYFAVATRSSSGTGERMRIDSSGRLMVGTTSAMTDAQLTIAAPLDVALGFKRTDSAKFDAGIKVSGGHMTFHTGSDSTTVSGIAERMRVDSVGNIYVGRTADSNNDAGTSLFASGFTRHNRSNATVMALNRTTSDGNLIEFRQAGTLEGKISVSGSTVSYSGGHLSRWSQLADGAERTEILRGSVLSNLDEMCEWGDEDNEQLNRMKVSDVEGDANVAGVFQDWDDDDDTYTNDFHCAMTGDFVIRIAQGTTVARGDLLMSAGDGTAKPQDDDIVRSKTIAKVTSTTVSTTYSDGSYCVPCVLMAC